MPNRVIMTMAVSCNRLRSWVVKLEIPLPIPFNPPTLTQAKNHYHNIRTSFSFGECYYSDYVINVNKQ